MADKFGFSLGNVLSQAEQIARARIENKFAPRRMQLAEEAAVTGNAAAALQLGETRRRLGEDAMIRDARAGVVAAQPGLTDQERTLITLSPNEADELRDTFDQLDEKGRKALADNIEQIGQAAAYIKASPNPEQAYLDVKGMLPEDIQAQMPPQYREQDVDAWLAQATEFNELITEMKGNTEDRPNPPSGYRWTAGGGLAFIPGGPQDPATKGGGGLDTTAANGIRSTVALAYGGEYNPTTGEFSLLDPEEAAQMIEVVARAQEIVAEDNSIAPGRAVQMALQEVGKGNVTAPPPGGGNAAVGATTSYGPGGTPDPLGLGI